MIRVTVQNDKGWLRRKQGKSLLPVSLLLLFLLQLQLQFVQCTSDALLSESEHRVICEKLLKSGSGSGEGAGADEAATLLWAAQPKCPPRADGTAAKAMGAAGATGGTNDDGVSVHVITTHMAPHLIAVQKRSLDMFLRQAGGGEGEQLKPLSYTYTVLDDSHAHPHQSNWETEGTPAAIKAATEAVGGQYQRMPQDLHDDRRCLFPSTMEPFVNNANTRPADAYQYISRWRDVYCADGGVVLLIDADVLLTAPWSPVAALRHNKLPAADGSEVLARDSSASNEYLPLSFLSVKIVHRSKQSPGFAVNVTFAWTAVNAMDMRSLPGRQDINWDCGRVPLFEGTAYESKVLLDTAGHTFEWLAAHKPAMRWLSVQQVYDVGKGEGGRRDGAATWAWFAQQWQETYRAAGLMDLEFKSQLIDGVFLHLRNAGNWMGHGKRYKALQPLQIELLEKLLEKRREDVTVAAV